MLCRLTQWVSQEDEAPDTGDVADDEADGQNHPLSNTLTQPAHKHEASDHLHTAETIHNAVFQLPIVEVLLSQWSHHGLRREWCTVDVGTMHLYLTGRFYLSHTFA